MPENMKLGVSPLPCICCNKALKPACPPAEDSEGLSTNQPYAGTCFETSGHYGSTIFDMCAGFLQISVCDDCIRSKAKEGLVAHIHTRRPRTEVVSVLPFDPDRTEWSPD